MLRRVRGVKGTGGQVQEVAGPEDRPEEIPLLRNPRGLTSVDRDEVLDGRRLSPHLDGLRLVAAE